MRHIPSAMDLYQYEIHRYVLDHIFSSANKRGKKLRDGILHTLSESDLDEVCYRERELHRSMD